MNLMLLNSRDLFFFYFMMNLAEYAWLLLIPPYLQPGNAVNQFTYGVNFASSGAGALVETYQPQVFDYHNSSTLFAYKQETYKFIFGDMLRVFISKMIHDIRFQRHLQEMVLDY